ncbi:hypothetical protein V7O62_00900 [Methanolobus sp. ZRKC2]|uniref:hypothetical protein n=1 Tax=Methanolobus sp. ZRKC2 TaxID=3125783 RepID=UPI0032528315
MSSLCRWNINLIALLLILISFCSIPASCTSYEEIKASCSYKAVETERMQEIVHFWINNIPLTSEEYEVELIKDCHTYFGNGSYITFTKTRGEPIDTKNLMIVTFNPNARGNQTMILMPNCNNTNSLSFKGTSPFWNRGNIFPITGQFFGEYIWQPGMTVIADEYSNYQGAIWVPEKGEYHIGPSGRMTGMQAMFADWGDDPADPADDSLHAGDVVSVMLVDSSKNEILFEKEVMVSDYPTYPIRLANGTANFKMGSSVVDGEITLEYFGGNTVYPENVAIEISHGLPTMNGYLPGDVISYPPNSPLLPRDFINISFENNCFSYTDPFDGTTKTTCNPLLAEQIICEGEVFRLSLIDTRFNDVLDSGLLIMGGEEIPQLVEKEPITFTELQKWIHCWVNGLPEPLRGPSADFHVELHKDISTAYGNMSYLSIQQTAGDTIHTKDLKIITTNPNARGDFKTREILPGINNTKTFSFEGTSPFWNQGNFPTTGQSFGDFVLVPGIIMIAYDSSNNQDVIWDPDVGDYVLSPSGSITGMQAMFADWGDNPADPADDTLHTGDNVSLKIIHIPSNEVLFDEAVTINEDSETDYPFDIATFTGNASISGENITLNYSGGSSLYREHFKVILSTTGILPQTVFLSEESFAFYPSNEITRNVAMDLQPLTASEQIKISFETESHTYNHFTEETGPIECAIIGDSIVYEGTEFSLFIVDTGSGQIINVQELTMGP